jgi:hypothetical protein
MCTGKPKVSCDSHYCCDLEPNLQYFRGMPVQAQLIVYENAVHLQFNENQSYFRIQTRISFGTPQTASQVSCRIVLRKNGNEW